MTWAELEVQHLTSPFVLDITGREKYQWHPPTGAHRGGRMKAKWYSRGFNEWLKPGDHSDWNWARLSERTKEANKTQRIRWLDAPNNGLLGCCCCDHSNHIIICFIGIWITERRIRWAFLCVFYIQSAQDNWNPLKLTLSEYIQVTSFYALFMYSFSRLTLSLAAF